MRGVFEFGRRFHLHARLVQELDSLLGMAAQVALIAFMRFVDLLRSFLNVLLRLGQAGVQGRIDVGTLGYNDSRENQAHGEQSDDADIFLVHVFLLGFGTGGRVNSIPGEQTIGRGLLNYDKRLRRSRARPQRQKQKAPIFIGAFRRFRNIVQDNQHNLPESVRRVFSRSQKRVASNTLQP